VAMANTSGMVHVSEESQTESSNRCGLTADDETIDDYTDSEDSDEIGAMCGPGEQIAFLERQLQKKDVKIEMLKEQVEKGKRIESKMRAVSKELSSMQFETMNVMGKNRKLEAQVKELSAALAANVKTA